MPSVRSWVPVWLSQEGLEQYVPNFQGITEEQFLSLQLPDYEIYGVLKQDKEVLFKLIKKIKAKQQSVTPDKWFSEGGPLMDIYETNDMDFRSRQMQQHAAVTAAPVIDPPSLYDVKNQPRIRVVIRKRPMMQKEFDRGEDDITLVDPEENSITINEPKVKVDLTNYTEYHRFVFDSALNEGVSNDEVYRSTVQPLVGSVFRKGKATCFAYGQTGSGKTYTMSPLPLRTAADMFSILARPDYQHLGLFVSCFEIYGGKLFDLLNNKEALICLEDARKNVCIKGLKEYAVEDIDTLEQLIKVSESCRSTGTTGANDQSSRSHSIMQFALKEVDGRPNGGKVVGKISFIDLAGSERGADTFDNDKQTRLEGAEINKSLLALKECIRALDMDQRHIPFRGSKLTEVLRDSFQGQHARLVMIGNISPTSSSCEHTLNTLRYADRVKELRKDRSDRSAGGVTPGAQGYKVAAQRGRQQASKPPPLATVQERSQQAGMHNNATMHKRAANAKEERTTQRVRMDDVNMRTQSDLSDQRYWNEADRSRDASGKARVLRVSQGSARMSSGGGEVDTSDRNDLIEDIFEEEDQLVAVHRQYLETNMLLMKKDMALLQYVDEPGSSLEQYVSDLTSLVQQRMDSNQHLLQRLSMFKRKLDQSQRGRQHHRS